MKNALNAFLKWRQQYARFAWRPVVAEGDSGLTASKFSGTPWLPRGDVWPRCKRCIAPLQLFLQLDLGNLPAPVRGTVGDGLLQFFNCSELECGPTLGDWEAFSDATIVRVVHPGRDPGELRVEIPHDPFPHGRFPPRSIVNWVQEQDFPHSEEWEDLGLVAKLGPYSRSAETYTHWDLAWAGDGVDFGRVAYDEFKGFTESLSGDKLGGWPFWVQFASYPSCRICDQPMKYLFQLDSNDNIPHMFGDNGVGRITQCPQHKDVVAFTYECC